MSLLLEALKKAELAKQGTKPDTGVVDSIEFEPEHAEREAEPKTIITREDLPDISPSLEILGDELPSQPVRRPPARTEPSPEAAASAISSARPAASKAQTFATPTQAKREAARQIFETKETEYNPRRNFYVAIGVVIAAGACYAGYVWWQLQPRAVYSATARQSPSRIPPVSQTAPATAPQVASTAAPATATPEATVPPKTDAGTTLPAIASNAAPGGPVFTRRLGAAAVTPRTPGAATAAASPKPAHHDAPPITITPPTLAVDPAVERAYAFYQQGDLTSAHDAYQQVLQRDPVNRDALLGLAAIGLRQRNFDIAETRYLKLLEADPRDVNALAGLMSLRGQANPVQSESRVKFLIAGNPDAPYLHFLLGNLYAQQARWPEAQAAYFKAYTSDPENADFTFNLAVSLDQMHQKQPALGYYQRAISLAAARPASFDRVQANARVQELQRQ
jgi:tetratricopeptide (TPR) repeat protein